MTVRNYTLFLGVCLLLFGLAGFIPGVNHMHTEYDSGLRVEGPGTGHLLGLFHTNVLSNLAHAALGLTGLVLALRSAGTRSYCRFVCILFAVFALMGLIGALQTTFGLLPLEGHNVWLHAATAAVAGYFGYLHTDPALAAPGAKPTVASYR